MDAQSQQKFPRARIAQRAFTLIEMMVVIVIVGLLAGATTMSVRSYLVRGKQSVAQMEISKIAQAIDTFYTAYDRYPSTDEGIEVLREKTTEFPDGLLSKLPRDPWKNAFVYLCPGRDAPYEIVSYGADKQEGGEGANRDISSAEMEAE